MKFPRVRNATKVRYGAWHSTQRHKVSQWTKVLLLRLFSTSHVGPIHFTQFAALISKCYYVNHEYVTNTHYSHFHHSVTTYVSSLLYSNSLDFSNSIHSFHHSLIVIRKHGEGADDPRYENKLPFQCNAVRDL